MKNLSDYQKILQVIEAKGVKIQDAETLCGLGTTTLQKLKTRNGGTGKLHKDNLQKFLGTFHVNPNWWKTGEGEKFLPEAKPEPPPIKPDPLIIFVETLTRLMEKNDNLLDRNVRLVDEKNGEIGHLRSNEKWYQNLIDELKAEARLSKSSK